MKILSSATLCLAVLVGMVFFNSTDVQAQGPTKVALIDIGKVFKSHPNFSAELAKLKAEADQFKMQADRVRADMMQRAEELRKSELKPGSERYKEIESQMAQEAAKIDVEQKSRLRELMTREAKLHFDTYKQVSAVIRDFCQPQQIQLVLRYNSQGMNPENPQSIMDKVNGSVVYFAPGKDVTDAIIAKVQQSGTITK